MGAIFGSRKIIRIQRRTFTKSFITGYEFEKHIYQFFKAHILKIVVNHGCGNCTYEYISF